MPRSTIRKLEQELLLAAHRLAAAIVAEQQGEPPARAPSNLREAVAQFERKAVLAALSATGGNVRLAARRLGIGYSTMKSRLAKLRKARRPKPKR